MPANQAAVNRVEPRAKGRALERGQAGAAGCAGGHGHLAVELARRLRCDPKAVRRLVDLGHRSHVDEVERALRALNGRLLIAGWSDAA